MFDEHWGFVLSAPRLCPVEPAINNRWNHRCEPGKGRVENIVASGLVSFEESLGFREELK